MKTMDDRTAFLGRSLMNATDFANWGLPAIAYFKHEDNGGQGGWSIHAADGTVIGAAPSRDTAFAAILQHDMEPMSVH
ncbi:hypothetical protein CCC_03929 [Paramagnetospirillum magnetotacticum MS-1]|uniref:DUF1150 family protein n=1 Tax=Paramagnetospirillum magnetotacticum MS-1 TaxID=272627 RepID=A0A0C2UE23_PARME|nr:DUF1150 family protein [Paramagnetospirillum magnetotacticum]KIL99757.1 hypothetical protein CCC_03929 [Paramagnetospirillum magnetotacticum MS-1]